MTDEDQIRSLLTLAAEVPDDLQPPVGKLIERGRSHRARRTGLIALTAAAAVVVAGGLPFALRAAGHGPVSTPGQVGGRVPAGLFGPLPGDWTGGWGPPPSVIQALHWSALPPSPLGPRTDPVLAWTGAELIELGGTHRGATTSDGAAYDPATRRWHRIAQVTGNVGFTDGVAAWTGRQLFVANGQFASCPATRSGATPAGCWPRAGLYDPAANSWSTTRLPGPLDGLVLNAATWTGRDMVVAGVAPRRGRMVVAAYDPVAHRWTIITPALPAGHPPQAAALLALPDRLFLWSLWSRSVRTSPTSGTIYSGVDVLTLGPSGRWADVTGSWPQHQGVQAPASAGGRILVSPAQFWCGTCSHPYFAFPGYFADPATLHRTPIPAGPIGQTEPAYIWTGAAIIAVNMNAEIGNPGHYALRPGDVARYDPAARTWRRLPAAPGQPTLSATPAWTGTQLLMLTDAGQLFALHG